MRNLIPNPSIDVPDIIERRPPITYRSSNELINRHLVDTPKQREIARFMEQFKDKPGPNPQRVETVEEAMANLKIEKSLERQQEKHRSCCPTAFSQAKYES